MRKTLQLPTLPILRKQRVLAKDAFGKTGTQDSPVYDSVRDGLNVLYRFLVETIQTLNTSEQVRGVDIASDTTISVSAYMHNVTGSTDIETIMPPSGFGGGWLILLNGGTWSLLDTGNIASAYTPSANEAVSIVYDQQHDRWYIPQTAVTNP